MRRSGLSHGVSITAWQHQRLGLTFQHRLSLDSLLLPCTCLCAAAPPDGLSAAQRIPCWGRCRSPEQGGLYWELLALQQCAAGDSSMQQVTVVCSLSAACSVCGAAGHLTTAAPGCCPQCCAVTRQQAGLLGRAFGQSAEAGLSCLEATQVASLLRSVSARGCPSRDGGCTWARWEHFCRLRAALPSSGLCGLVFYKYYKLGFCRNKQGFIISSEIRPCFKRGS